MTNKLKYFIANWKMFGDFSSFKIIKKTNQYLYKEKSLNKKKVVFCVPYTLIDFFKKKIKSKFISLGAQNCHHYQNYGPFTGSVSASMLKNVGAKYIILGHSENRSSGDSNYLIKKKIKLALNEKLNIIFCIGESKKDRKKTFAVLKKQLKGSLPKKYDFNKIIFAYEPIWSIGTGKIPKANDLIKIFNFIIGG